jgi:hypothetical protein
VAGLRSFKTNRFDFKRLQAAPSRGARRRRRPWLGLRWVEHAVGAEVVHDREQGSLLEAARNVSDVTAADRVAARMPVPLGLKGCSVADHGAIS